MPRCGIQIGKGAVPTIGNNYFSSVTVTGFFGLAPMFNNASETTAFLRCKFENQYDSPTARSEEHTSELQPLMRISYAVFCLKKKNNTHNHTIKSTHANKNHKV